ncbi:ectoine hydrolase DoeA [Anaerobacillus alkalilacustris]|uniref:Ectoine hydrolase DoeA n=1 Tax=Anaerobacillus alkalilacustris TaxID=393763 RepID=A0A1S2LWA1_9BACI|nr:M24 family metallopeptidase [Anaerobacillus alkalilacustris]OIJ16822.1 ectoine hydrolase DoeA [Anaerobacillus alkalilacustris]
MLPFDISEYQNRLSETKQLMAQRGIEVLLVTDPANINYLSGYDAWSFYVHQMLMIIIDEAQPIWIGRNQDGNGAKKTTWLSSENVIGYPDYYVHSTIHHPMDFIADILRGIGHGKRYIGVEMDNYYFSAKAYAQLSKHLCYATFKDAGLLVNFVRLVKSDQEIEYMKRAGKIADQAMKNGVEYVRTGLRECDAAAKIYQSIIAGTDEYGGDYPAIAPLLPSGENTSSPHLTWTDRMFKEGDEVIIELAGCYKRYHVPLARTITIGTPSEELKRLSPIVIEGLNEVLEAVKPGLTCGELESAWCKSLKKHGIEKESRLGYSVGLNYPPDWGEHTASIRNGDLTILKPNMTFHLIPGLWFDNYGIEISETFRVTEKGCETFTTFPRQLILQDPFSYTNQDGKIS